MAEESIGTARIDVVVNTATMDAGIEASKRRVSGLGAEAEAQFNKSSASAKRYADSLLRQTDMLGKTRAEQIAYNAQLRIGGELGEKIAAKALAQQAAMSKELGVTGKSAKEMQFAMRGLPAQITDITVGLASGQRPLMVLLQQGGQLKDMFGGIGPAAKALGSSLLGLINPFTVTAAAAGALLLAWKQGSDEAIAYNKAIITTGNYAGITAGQIGELAKSIKGSTDATQHAASAALAQVVSSGKFAGAQIENVGRAAVAMSTLTGQATAETIRQFEQIGEKPVEAILKLNDAQHFLTQETYAQIKALEDQGRTQEAASLAMKTYSDALQDRAKEVVDNAGTMERAWHAVATTAKQAWDAMLDVGRPEGDDDKLGRLQREANAAAIAYENLKKNPPTSTWYSQNLQDKAYYAKYLADAKTRSDAAIKAYHDEEHKQEDARKAAAGDALKARLAQDRADSDREVRQFATNAQKRAAEIAKVHGEYNERIARAVKSGDQKLANDLRASEKLVLAGVADKYKDPKTPKPKEVSAFESFQSYVNNLDAKSISEDTSALTKYEQGIASLGNELNKYMAKGGDAAKAAGLFNEGQKALSKTLEESRSKATAQIQAYAASLKDMLDTRQQEIDLQVESIGMGAKEARQKQNLIAIDEDYNRKKASLERQQRNTSSEIDKAGYQKQLDDLKKYHDERVRMELDGARRADEARAKFSNGAAAALADFNDSAKDVAGASYALFSNAFDGMADSLANFVTTGKLDFKSLVTSFLSDLAKMEMRILASKVLMSIFGGGAATGSEANGAQNATIFDGGWGGAYAKGDVFFNSPSLSAYSSQVIDKPTMFAFARGAGVMGEAGPEAIMPLKRGPDGRLGVAVAGGGNGGVVFNQTINVDSSGSASEQSSGSNADAMREFAGRMKAVAQQTIVDEQRPGGSLWRMAHA